MSFYSLALLQEDAVAMSYAESRRKLLPTFDVDAKEPHLVYDVRDIAGDDAWHQVCRVTDACFLKKEGNFVSHLTSRGEKWYESVVSVLNTIRKESPHAKKQIKTCILLNHMISFHNRTAEKQMIRGTTEEVAQFLNFPMEICTRFLDLFTSAMFDDISQQEGFTLSKQLRQKCLVHICLLYLMAHGDQMKAANILPLAKDARMELKDAATLLREAGCTVASRGSNIVCAALTVPLTFPPPKRGGRGPS